MAFAKLKDKCGLIDQTSNWVINPQFDHVGPFAENGLAPIQLNGKWGCIDITGKFVIKPQFDNEIIIYKNSIFIRQNYLWGIIDKNGKTIAEPQFSWGEFCSLF